MDTLWTIKWSQEKKRNFINNFFYQRFIRFNHIFASKGVFDEYSNVGVFASSHEVKFWPRQYDKNFERIEYVEYMLDAIEILKIYGEKKVEIRIHQIEKKTYRLSWVNEDTNIKIVGVENNIIKYYPKNQANVVSCDISKPVSFSDDKINL